MAWQYHITLREQLALELDPWFEDLYVSVDESGHSLVDAQCADQAAFISLLERLHALNFTLLAFTRDDRPALKPNKSDIGV
jgi:hypothetical protein